jgi:hypothetical protein
MHILVVHSLDVITTFYSVLAARILGLKLGSKFPRCQDSKTANGKHDPADRFQLLDSPPFPLRQRGWGQVPSLGIKSPSFPTALPSAKALLDSYLRLRTLTPREEPSLALDTIELERIWVRVEFDSYSFAFGGSAVRLATMAIWEISTPRAVALGYEN